MDDGAAKGISFTCDPPGPDEADSTASEIKDKNGAVLDVYIHDRDADGNGIFDQATRARRAGQEADLRRLHRPRQRRRATTRSARTRTTPSPSSPRSRSRTTAASSRSRPRPSTTSATRTARSTSTSATATPTRTTSRTSPRPRPRSGSAAAASTRPNGPSLAPSISDDGSFVAFESTATNLSAGAGANGRRLRHLRPQRQDQRADAHHERGRSGDRAVAVGQRRTRRVPARHRRDRDRQRRDRRRRRRSCRPRRVRSPPSRTTATRSRTHVEQPGVRHQRHRRRDRADEHARRRHGRQRGVG